MRRKEWGQATAEYMVLLSVAVVIGLVAIQLIIPNAFGGADAEIRQSQTYWKRMAPVGVEDHQDPYNTTFLALIVKNNENVPIIIDNAFALSPNGVWGQNSSRELDPGQTELLVINHQPSPDNITDSCIGQTYRFDLNFSYHTKINPVRRLEVGGQPIVGYCIPGAGSGGASPGGDGNGESGGGSQGGGGQQGGASQCGGNTQTCGQNCCPPGQPCCGGDVCCPNGWICENNVCKNKGQGIEKG